jgi:quercetin dioxygenase-like cupin family protein
MNATLPLALLFLFAPTPPPPRGAPPARVFSLAELEREMASKIAGRSSAYLSFLATPTLRCGVYRIGKGAEDPQAPHSEDEVYHVLRGKARIEIAGETYAATAGSVFFVAADVPHRFVAIEEEIEVFVFFSNAIPVTGGMAAFPPPTRQEPFPETSPRGSTRIFYWHGPGSAGQVEIDHGLPNWNPAYESFLAGKAVGAGPPVKRWRFGQNFWTRLDSNIDLEIGGVALRAGDYYLVLEHDPQHGLRLVALDPEEIRGKRLDAFQAPRTQGGIVMPLRHESDLPVADRLAIRLALDAARSDEAELEIRFGPHRLTAPVTMHPARS